MPASPDNQSPETATPEVAVAICRMSRKVETDDVASPKVQRGRLAEEGPRFGYEIPAGNLFEEYAVSGGRPLAKRPGLRRAVEAIEAGRASILVVPYFDRLVRDLVVQREITDRVEAAGGRVLALDFGVLSNETPAQWVSGQMLGVVSEYFRRSVGERTQGAKARAVREGRLIFDRVPLGYRRRDDRTLEPDVDEEGNGTAPLVVEAFERRLAGGDRGTIAAIRDWLNSEPAVVAWLAANRRPKERRVSDKLVQTMLASRLYLGEFVWGKPGTRTYLENLEFCEAIVPRRLFERVADVRVPRGRRCKSGRLLARLSVARCATCSSRLSVGEARGRNGGRYPLYQCCNDDCSRRVSIVAHVLEAVVLERTEAILEANAAALDVRLGLDAELGEASTALDSAQKSLDAAIRVYAAAGVLGEAAAVEEVAALRQSRDNAERAHGRLLALATGPSVSVGAGDFAGLSLERQREVIAAVVEVAEVAPSPKGARGNLEATRARVRVDAKALAEEG